MRTIWMYRKGITGTIGYLFGVYLMMSQVWEAWHGAIAHHAFNRPAVDVFLAVITIGIPLYLWKIAKPAVSIIGNRFRFAKAVDCLNKSGVRWVPGKSLIWLPLLAVVAFGADVKPAAGPPLSDAQKIFYHLGQTPHVPVALKWKTIIVLPSSEKLLDVVCGFTDDWDIYAPKDSNFVMVTPLKAGARTDLAIVTKSSNIYTIEVEDVSKMADAHAYTQVLIEAADDKMKAALNDSPKYYGADDVAAFRAQALKAEKDSKEMAAKLAQETEDAKAEARANAQKSIKHDYHFDEAAASRAPWNIVTIWHDDRFSYVEGHPSEQFAVYAVTEGKPTAVDVFPSGDGSLRMDRIVDNGYFKLGKKELKFSR